MNSMRFEQLVAGFSHLLDDGVDERTLLEEGAVLLRDVIAVDDWLPDACSVPHPQYYQQYLLYLDPAERFSVVSFVWGPGQTTPVHDHTVWALIGMLRGAEMGERFAVPEQGQAMRSLGTEILHPGDIEVLSPATGDIHRVSNYYNDQVSISIHIYGADIGKVQRYVYNDQDGSRRAFVSGYANR
ncbi:cysteine dioxygenase family protein [Oxalicibacterium faecigallinarum]|uniref:3-mercaptopropionate dioxygenase n=1 Tax=Oxalicibacterium faecigallinarum TaxID=573741 RepID=A0A8J3B085_9BURK|nr:cysteine dioxygenase [Oxalicibacterium faecigallinarum]GGI20952.1 3-mercaptopropionate dioxygenase [Oxalicibacterium faecigallinarum]